MSLKVLKLNAELLPTQAGLANDSTDCRRRLFGGPLAILICYTESVRISRNHGYNVYSNLVQINGLDTS